jgi:hypothetical protein
MLYKGKKYEKSKAIKRAHRYYGQDFLSFYFFKDKAAQE